MDNSFYGSDAPPPSRSQENYYATGLNQLQSGDPWEDISCADEEADHGVQWCQSSIAGDVDLAGGSDGAGWLSGLEIPGPAGAGTDSRLGGLQPRCRLH